MIYGVPEICDRWYPEYQLVAEGGDVVASAGSDFEHLLRAVASLPLRSATVAIRFVFAPKPKNRDMQSRLGVYVMARNRDGGLGDESLRVVLERGQLSRFYKLKSNGKGFEAPWDKIGAVCEIVRREDAVKPLHEAEFNDRIPPYYYAVRLFEANNHNDYMDLDRVLGDIREQVLIDVCVEPADVSNELLKHTRYLSQLQSVNRLWDRDQDDDLGFQDYLGNESDWRSAQKQTIKPLRYQDPLADNILRSQQRFHESLRQPHLSFNIRVLSETPAVAQLGGSVVAESAFEGGSYRLLTWTKESEFFDRSLQSVKETQVLQSSLHEYLFQEKDPTPYSGLARLSRVATVDELLGVFRLPVASARGPHCIRKNTDPPHEKEDFIVLGCDEQNPGVSRGARVSVLAKHMFVSGTPGSGKTTSMLNLLLGLNQRDIPFLVIEPVKTEYRILKTFRNHPDKDVRRLAEIMEVYTAGEETISPLRLNPLGDENIENVLSCFKAAIPMEGSLPALLGEALERVYEEHPDKPPIMTDLVAAAEQVLAEKGYSSDTNSDFRAAIEARLGILTRRIMGRIFQCRKSVPAIDHLLNVPAIIELDSLTTEQACLITLFLLTGIREYVKTLPRTDKNPRYVIVIEEAHNIVGRAGPAVASPDVADPKALAAEYVCRMLAELRALGVAIIIVDQLPSAVAPEVVKNTTTKVAFRQVDKEDREALGDSMVLSPAETEELARLNPGEAFFYTEGYHGSRRIKTLNLHSQFDFSTAIENQNILPYLKDDVWFQESALERATQELSELRENMDRFDHKRVALIRELASLLATHPQVLAEPRSESRSRRLSELRERVYQLKHRLSRAYKAFVRDSYRRYLTSDSGCEVCDSLVLQMRDNLVGRFESVVRPDVEKTLGFTNGFIDRCNNA